MEKFGLRLVRSEKGRMSKEQRLQYEKDLALAETQTDWKIIKAPSDTKGKRERTHQETGCEFLSKWIERIRPPEILDIGSYRQFCLGVASYYSITALDVRELESDLKNEKIVVADAKVLPFPDESFDMVSALDSIPYFGLGRYGDEIDMGADKKAIQEMIRVLKPGGHLIFTAPIKSGLPILYFNAARAYNLETIRELCQGLNLVEEKFYSRDKKSFVQNPPPSNSFSSLGYYLGCWQK